MKKVFVAIFALLTVGSCSFKMLTVNSIEKPDVEKFSLDNSDISFGLNVNNPNKIGFRLVKTNLTVVVNKVEVGKVALGKKIKIKANSTSTIPVQLKMDSGKLLSIGTMSFFSDPEILIKGNVKGRKFIFSKKYALEYKDHFSIQDFMGK
jgi:LEA14-like dessication related protein